MARYLGNRPFTFHAPLLNTFRYIKACITSIPFLYGGVKVLYGHALDRGFISKVCHKKNYERFTRTVNGSNISISRILHCIILFSG